MNTESLVALIRDDVIRTAALPDALGKIESAARAAIGAGPVTIRVGGATKSPAGAAAIELPLDSGAIPLGHIRAEGATADATPILTNFARLAAIALELDDRRRVEERLRRNHSVLMRLARSPHIGTGALDEALDEITEAASEVLNVERSSIWTYNADHSAILCLELFIRTNKSHESGVELPASSFPGYFAALREERTIPAHDAHTDPRTREFSAPYLAPLGIGAMLDAPIRVGGSMIGVICNEHVGPARTWTTDEEQFAASLADFIALAMESGRRKESEDQLRAMVQALEGES